DVAGPDFLDGTALALSPTTAGGDDQRLTERVRVPGGAGPRLECDAGSSNTRRVGGIEQPVDPDGAGKIILRTLFGRARADSFDVHVKFLVMTKAVPISTVRLTGSRGQAEKRVTNSTLTGIDYLGLVQCK